MNPDGKALAHRETQSGPSHATEVASARERALDLPSWNPWVPGFVLASADLAVAFGTLIGGAAALTLSGVPVEVPWGAPFAVGAWLAFRSGVHLYPGTGLSGPEALRRVSITTLLALCLHGGLLLAEGWGVRSTVVALAGWTCILPVSWFVRARALGLLARSRRYAVPVLVVGGGETGIAVVRELRRNRQLGLEPAGYFSELPDRASRHLRGVPWLGPPGLVLNGTVPQHISNVIVALPDLPAVDLPAFVAGLRRRYRRVSLVPNPQGSANLGSQKVPLGFPQVRPGMGEAFPPRGLRVKRALDLTIGVPLFVLSLPLIGVAGLAVWLADRGPIFFAHERESRDGRMFRMWKLRTMVTNAEALLEETLAADPEARRQWEARMKLENDPRIIPRVGDILRRLSLDELPQFWNVVRGDMSLVGPRPFPIYHLEQFSPAFRRLRQRVPTGLTGYWQVTVRSSGDLKAQEFADTHYIENWSIWMDLWVLQRTLSIVLSGAGAK